MAVEESCLGALRSTSVSPPAHYILNIQQFSALIKQNIERYESNEFEAAGYKWKLVIYPNGNKSKNAGEFLSVYVAMADSTSLPPGWEVYATFRIFLLDQIDDSYMTLEDEINEGRFHRLRTECGFDKFINLTEFGDSKNGYLVGDNCVFGAEVFVSKETCKGKTESLSMVMDAVPYTHFWKINNYTQVNPNCETSNIFTLGAHKWKILLYPNGVRGVGGDYISLKLALADLENLPSETKILAEFTLRMWDQLHSKHYSCTDSHWFSASNSECGWQRFISHDTFFETNRGLLYRDVCFIQAKVAIHGEMTHFG